MQKTSKNSVSFLNISIEESRNRMNVYQHNKVCILIASIRLNGQKTETISYKVRNKIKVFTLPTLTQKILELLTRAKKHKRQKEKGLK
jgi:hypothetical protein